MQVTGVCTVAPYHWHQDSTDRRRIKKGIALAIDQGVDAKPETDKPPAVEPYNI